MDDFLTHQTYYKHLLSIIMEYMAATRFNKSLDLLIYHTSFIFFELSLSSKSINQMIKLKRIAKTFFHRQSLKRLEKEISEELIQARDETSKGNDDMLDIKKLIDLEARFYTMEQHMVDSVKLYHKLIEAIDQPMVSIGQLRKDFQELTVKVNHVKEVFSTGGSNSNPRTISSYIVYIVAIMNNFEEAKRWIKILERKMDHISHYKRQDKVFFMEELMYNEESSLIQVGALKENLGKIISPNQGMERLFGYSIDYLVGKNINLIIPYDLGSLRVNSYHPPDVSRELHPDRQVSYSVQREKPLWHPQKWQPYSDWFECSAHVELHREHLSVHRLHPEASHSQLKRYLDQRVWRDHLCRPKVDLL